MTWNMSDLTELETFKIDVKYHFTKQLIGIDLVLLYIATTEATTYFI